MIAAAPPATSRTHRFDGYQAVLVAAMALFVMVFVVQAFRLHAAMRTHKADLGQMDQAVWNSSRGHLLEQTDNGYIATRLSDHVEPVLALISPIYWLWDDVRALLALQALAVAAGAWPLYALALRRLDLCLTRRERAQVWQREPLRRLTRPVALALALAFLLTPQLQSAVLTEFHAAPLAVPLLLWALWSVEAQRWKQFATAALLVALVKEEMALLAALLGVWAVWRAWRQARAGESASMQRGALWGGVVAVAGVVWFGVATFVIVPRFAQAVYGVAESGYFARYGALGASPAGIVRSLFTQPATVWSILTEPARVHSLWALLLPFGFLSLLAPDVLLIALPLLMANTLSAYPAQYYGEFHYAAPVAAVVAAAAAFGAGRLWGWIWRRTAGASPAFQHAPAAGAGTMAAVSLVSNAATAVRPLAAAALVVWIGAWALIAYAGAGRGPWGGRYDPVAVTAHHRLLERFVAQIPADAPLTATAAVHPHVSHRRYVYQFPLGLDAPEAATWALLDVTTNTDMAPGDLKAQVDAMLAGGWGVVDAADGFLLLAQGEPARTIPDDFYSFARDAGDEGSASGVTVDDWPRWRQSRLTAHWPKWSPATGPPTLEVTTPDGEKFEPFGQASPPALVWLPADQWREGEAYHATSLPLSLPRTVAARASGAGETLILRRVAGDELASALLSQFDVQDYGAAIAELTGRPLVEAQARFVSEGGPLRLTAWTEERPVWPGDSVDLWLQWQGSNWPQDVATFVHLRRNGENLAQADGPPRLFGDETGQAMEAIGFANDWRTLSVPDDAPLDGEYSLVVGLYKRATGERLPLADGGAEVVVRTFHLNRAVADQACALNAAACASQAAPY